MSYPKIKGKKQKNKYYPHTEPVKVFYLTVEEEEELNRLREELKKDNIIL